MYSSHWSNTYLTDQAVNIVLPSLYYSSVEKYFRVQGTSIDTDNIHNVGGHASIMNRTKVWSKKSKSSGYLCSRLINSYSFLSTYHFYICF